MTDIWTAQYRYSGPDRLDITVKGNHPIGRIFAPTWKMVMDYKNGKGGEQAYIEAYRTLLNDRFTEMIGSLTWLFQQDEVTFVCFCSPGAFCHRVLLAKDILKDVVIYKGERR